MMKRISFLILCLIFSLSMLAYDKEWENPTVVDRGKEQPHAWFKTSNCKSLNGTWRFRYDDDVKDAPNNFYLDSYDDKNWHDISVPSNWEMKGFGAMMYVNIKYPWTANPPFIDIPNPVGTYRTTFDVPSSWSNRELILYFGSITGYARIYLNGHEVGMTKCSKTPAEFNITNYIRSGKNLLAVQVYRWHDGSYMEDQDFWRMTGIEREVYIQAYPRHCVWDYCIKAEPTNDYKDGMFTADIFLRSFNNAKAAGNVQISLRNNKGRVVYKASKPVLSDKVTFCNRINNVNLWSAEKPNLYDLDIVYAGDTIHERVGFREVKIVGPRLLVNGHIVYIKGVNHHEHNDSLGHVPSRDIMMHDLRLLKSLNINAVRSSHYPNDPLWLRLCDEYGIYVVDEANIETHGMGSLTYFTDTVHHPAYRPEWAPAHRDRIQRMFYRDRNHPCIIGWSLGNECGNGAVFHEQYLWLKRNDKTRYVQFEQAWETWNTDVVALMYPNWGWLKNYAKSGFIRKKEPNPEAVRKSRPFIMCEYAHSQGNSTGNFQDFWNLIKSAPNLQGGFIWDFQDQGIKRTINENTDHRTYYMYNGGMGSYVWPQEENSGCDGIIAADGTYKPAAYEVKKVYQNIIFPSFDWKRQILSIRNEHNFTSLSEFDFAWTLNKDGVQVAEGSFNANTLPDDSTTVKIKLPEMSDGSEYSLQVYAYNKESTDVLSVHTEVAKEQFVRTADIQETAVKGDLTLTEDKNDIVFLSGNVEGRISKNSGKISSYTIDGTSLFVKNQYPEPYFWRAPNDNDYGNRMGEKSNLWRSLQTNYSVKSCSVGEKTAEGIPIEFVLTLNDIAQDYHLIYVIRNDGSVRIIASMNTTGKKALPEMPRFGMRMALEKGFENVEYYGRGPIENYCDRKWSQFLGIYYSTVSDLYYPYIRPQQCGNHTDTRWVEISSPKSNLSLRIEGCKPIEFSALHFRDEDLDAGITKKMLHTKDVLPRNETFVIIGSAQRGLGGDNSWGELPHQEYRLFDDNYELSYIIGLKVASNAACHPKNK